MRAPLGSPALQLGLGVAYVVLTALLWPRLFYLHLDPVMRGCLSRVFGVPVNWAYYDEGVDEEGCDHSGWHWSVAGGAESLGYSASLLNSANLLAFALTFAPVVAVVFAFEDVDHASGREMFLLLIVFLLCARMRTDRYIAGILRLGDGRELHRTDRA
jgi:hypothetical protein